VSRRHPGTLASIAGRPPRLPPCRRRPRVDAADSLYTHPHADRRPSALLGSEEGWIDPGAACPGNGGGRPPFSFAFPAPDRVPHALSGAARNQAHPRKQTIASRVRREAIDGCDARAMSPVWTRSGSRPINHGCSVRDPRPGSSSLNPSPAPKSVRRSVTDAPSGPRCAASRRATNLTVHLAARVWAGSPVNAWSKVDGVRAPGTGPPYPVANALQRRLLGPCTAPICPWALGVSRPTSRGGRRSDAGVAAA